MEEFEADLKKLKDAGWTPIQTGGEWMTQLTLQYLGVPTVIGENPDWYAGITSGDLTLERHLRRHHRALRRLGQGGLHPGRRRRHEVRRRRGIVPRRQVRDVPDGQLVRRRARPRRPTQPEIGVFAAPAAKGVKDPRSDRNLASPYLIMKASKHQDAADEARRVPRHRQGRRARRSSRSTATSATATSTRPTRSARNCRQIIADTPAEDVHARPATATASAPLPPATRPSSTRRPRRSSPAAAPTTCQAGHGRLVRSQPLSRLPRGARGSARAAPHLPHQPRDMEADDGQLRAAHLTGWQRRLPGFLMTAPGRS